MIIQLVDFKFPVTEKVNENEFTKIKDMRNGIICLRSPNISDNELIYNYYNFVNTHTADYKQYVYLNFGMTCLTYFPSFIKNNIRDLVRNKVKELGIEYYIVPSFSLFQTKSFDSNRDIICFKEDLAKALGKNEWECSALDFLKDVFDNKEVSNEYNKF